MPLESQQPEVVPGIPAPQPEGPISPDEPLPTVTVAEPEPEPFGRSWAFDLDNEQFVRVGASQGPRAIYGPVTLIQWIDKCLHTERGALPIHPDGYGLEDPFAIFGRPIRELSLQELQRQIEDALTFHPRIAAVVGMQLQRQDEQAYVSFQVQVDPPLDEAELLTVRLGVGAGSTLGAQVVQA